MLRTKIVCTLGPSTRDPEILTSLVKSGMDVARLNFSHGEHADHKEMLELLRSVCNELDRTVAVLIDLQGPKLRVGDVGTEGIQVRGGEELTLTTEPMVGRPGLIPVQFDDFPNAVAPQDHILIDDGLIELEVTDIEEGKVKTRVIVGGRIHSNKGMNLPRAPRNIEAITDKDKEDLEFALSMQVDWIALSFVRRAEEVIELKGLIRERSEFGRMTPVIAKIEKPEAIENIDEIIQAADGVMVARGDLGVEMAPEAVPMLQKRIITKCNEAGRPVITATQMLDSMMRNPRPTRAEASDVANAILDGSDAIMLSGETAAGRYPLKALRTMVRIAVEAERGMYLDRWRYADQHDRLTTVAEAVAHAACHTAVDLNCAGIIAPTSSGNTAKVLSKFRPYAPIVAVTPSPIAYRQLKLYWGVCPILSARRKSTDEVIQAAVNVAQEHGFVQPGDTVVVTAGSAGSAPGTTNLMKVHIIERILLRGTGIGEMSVRGYVRRLHPPVEEDRRVTPEDVIVMDHTDRTCVPILRRAAGLVTTEGGTNSHGAVLAAELGLPAIIGAEGDLDELKDGMTVTLEAGRGLLLEHRE